MNERIKANENKPTNLPTNKYIHKQKKEKEPN